MEPQKTRRAKAILRKKNKAGDITFPSITLQSDNNQNSMVLAEKQTHIPQTRMRTHK